MVAQRDTGLVQRVFGPIIAVTAAAILIVALNAYLEYLYVHRVDYNRAMNTIRKQCSDPSIVLDTLNRDCPEAQRIVNGPWPCFKALYDVATHVFICNNTKCSILFINLTSTLPFVVVLVVSLLLGFLVLQCCGLAAQSYHYKQSLYTIPQYSPQIKRLN